MHTTVVYRKQVEKNEVGVILECVMELEPSIGIVVLTCDPVKIYCSQASLPAPNTEEIKWHQLIGCDKVFCSWDFLHSFLEYANYLGDSLRKLIFSPFELPSELNSFLSFVCHTFSANYTLFWMIVCGRCFVSESIPGLWSLDRNEYSTCVFTCFHDVCETGVKAFQWIHNPHYFYRHTRIEKKEKIELIDSRSENQIQQKSPLKYNG